MSVSRGYSEYIRLVNEIHYCPNYFTIVEMQHLFVWFGIIEFLPFVIEKL